MFLFLFGFISGILAIGGAYLYVKDELPSVEMLRDVKLQTPMKVFTADGKLISQFGEKKRIPLKLDEIPDTLIQAFLATEDARFYEHPGVDFIGIVRAAFKVAVSGQKKQGASTITMQLARNFFLTRDKTYIRKIKEIFIAIHIENLLTKDEILELYLNKIELGYRSFGVGAAAEVYYGKTIEQLTLPEMAMIAGLPKAPSALNPIRNPERARDRRNTVLWRMLETKVINETTYHAAVEAPIETRFHGAQIELDAPYIAEMVRQEMVSRYGEEDAYTQGYQVYTTVLSQSQAAAQQATRHNLHAYDERHGYRGAQRQVWYPDEEHWSAKEIRRLLLPINDFGMLESVVVTGIDVENNSFEFTNRQGEISYVFWPNMNWARPFVSNDSQGKEPNSVQDIVQIGELIYVRPIKDNQWRLAQLPQASAALVSIDPNNGAIRALMGGYDFRQSEYNRVTQAKRQVGSNIKPFIYSAAIEKGFTLASIINDAPINQWDRRQGTVWRPKNSPAVYDGPTRMRVALAKSKNVVSVRLLRAVGIDDLVSHLTNFGFSPHELPKNESLALGSASLTPLEMVRGFATFSNGGFLVDTFLVDRIELADGTEVYAADPKIACLNCSVAQNAPELDEIQQNFDGLSELEQDAVLASLEEPNLAEQVISEQNAFLINQAMRSAITGGGDWRKKTGWNGTAWRARALKRKDIGGKTGTTNDAKDAWFSGFTSTEVATSWVGFDDHSKDLGKTKYNNNLGRNQIYGTEFGAKTALPAWIEYMQFAMLGVEEKPYLVPNDLVTVRIDQATGKLTKKTDYTAKFEYFIKGTEPTEYVEVNPNPDVLEAQKAGEVIEDDSEIF
nr:penicillin-binding protein 1A [Marinifaba aquimaris]